MRVGLGTHFRHHGAERDRGAQRLQRVLRPHQQGRRRLMADPLQRREDLDDDAAALLERSAKNMFALVERLGARLRRFDAGLDVAHARGGVDELLVERAPIVTDRVDFPLELRLDFRRLALLGASRLEFLIVLFEGVRVGSRGCGSGRGGRWPRDPGERNLRRPRRLNGRSLSERGQACAERECQSQGRPEHKARISAARPAENHACPKVDAKPRERKTKQTRCDRIKTPAWRDLSQISEATLRIIQGGQPDDKDARRGWCRRDRAVRAA